MSQRSQRLSCGQPVRRAMIVTRIDPFKGGFDTAAFVLENHGAEGGAHADSLRQSDLYDQLCERNLLEQAARMVLDHAEATPPINAVDRLTDNRVTLLDNLAWELRTRTYRPGPVCRVYRVYRGRPGVRSECVRVLQARDRVVVGALSLVVEPALELSGAMVGVTARVRAVIRASLRAGYYRVAPLGGENVLAANDVYGALRQVCIRVHDERILALIKSLLRAPLTEEYVWPAEAP